MRETEKKMILKAMSALQKVKVKSCTPRCRGSPNVLQLHVRMQSKTQPTKLRKSVTSPPSPGRQTSVLAFIDWEVTGLCIFDKPTTVYTDGWSSNCEAVSESVSEDFTHKHINREPRERKFKERKSAVGVVEYQQGRAASKIHTSATRRGWRRSWGIVRAGRGATPLGVVYLHSVYSFDRVNGDAVFLLFLAEHTHVAVLQDQLPRLGRLVHH